jgi:hypothetical protein
MMRNHGLTLIGAFVLLTTAVWAQDVTGDWDRQYDFNTIKTFATKLGTSWGNPLGEERVTTAVQDGLKSKGWKLVPEASADALAVMHGATDTKKDVNTFYSGWGGGWGYGGYGGMGMGTATTTVNEYKVGTLVVDIFDTKTKKLVYRGTASDEISDKPDKNIKTLKKAVDKMFKNFPPKPKKS